MNRAAYLDFLPTFIFTVISSAILIGATAANMAISYDCKDEDPVSWTCVKYVFSDYWKDEKGDYKAERILNVIAMGIVAIGMGLFILGSIRNMGPIIGKKVMAFNFFMALVVSITHLIAVKPATTQNYALNGGLLASSVLVFAVFKSMQSSGARNEEAAMALLAEQSFQ